MGQPLTTDTLTLGLSEDAYKDDARFTVTMDGVSLAAAQTVTASHAAGGNQAPAPNRVNPKEVGNHPH